MSNIYKAYDIRGVYPDELNEKTTNSIARAFAVMVKNRSQKNSPSVAVGSDMRISSPSLKQEVINGLLDSGVNVVDVGLVSSPTFYFAVGFYGLDGGIQVSASHNPPEYNGLKMVYEKGIALSKEEGIYEIRDMVAENNLPELTNQKGDLNKIENVEEKCVEEQIKNIDIAKIKQFKIVIDTGNGMGAKDMEALFKKLPCNIIKMNFELDGRFPNHPPDPMVEENISELKRKVVEEKADLGIAIDGDADRYFFVDEKGEAIPQSIMRGLLAQIELVEHPGATIAYDIRPGKITVDMIKEAGGIPLVTPVGHSLIKNIMIKNNIIYGGESSGHFAYKLPYGTFEAPIVEVTKFLLYISQKSEPVSEIIAPYKVYSHSGEINIKLTDIAKVDKVIKELKELYTDGEQNELDGLTVEYPDFWFNIRASNTEPLLRLAIEGTTKEIVEQKALEITKIIND